MPTLIPTAATGATAKPMPMSYVDPVLQQVEESLLEFMVGSGLDGPFMADLLSDMLSHERCGAALYRSVAGRTNNPVLRARYEEFGTETVEHIEILEELVASLGGNPGYVSPAARATEKTGSGLVEATFLLGGSLDLVTREQVMLEAVFLAEAKDQANWEGLARLAQAMQPGPEQESVTAATDRVKAQEDEHLLWAKETRAELVSLQAAGAVSKPGATPRELIEQIEGLL
jgi:ferritin-like metal-binding protein YciE